jgi:hypothetical protein
MLHYGPQVYSHRKTRTPSPNPSLLLIDLKHGLEFYPLGCSFNSSLTHWNKF